MNLQNAARAPKALIRGPIVDAADAVLPEQRGAHDARLDRDVEVALAEHCRRVALLRGARGLRAGAKGGGGRGRRHRRGQGARGEHAGDGDEFGVAGAVAAAVCGVHAAADDGPVVHQDTAHGRFVCCEGELGLWCGKGGVSPRDLALDARVRERRIWWAGSRYTIARASLMNPSCTAFSSLLWFSLPT